VLTVTLADHIPQPSRDALKQQCLTWGVAWQLQGPRGNQAAVLGLRGPTPSPLPLPTAPVGRGAATLL